MKYAIVSDIHANAQAWAVVAADIAQAEVDIIICLGDVVGYGPRPQEVLAAVRQVTGNIVMGNHDAVPGGHLDPAIFNDRARSLIEWTTAALDDESKEFLSRLPYTIGQPDGNILFTHADVVAPESWDYIVDVAGAKRNFAACPEQVVFFGHSHEPGVFVRERNKKISRIEPGAIQIESGKRYLINPGSVGDPRTIDIRASYCLYDSALKSLTFRQLPFDAEAYRSDLAAVGLDSKPWFLSYLDGETQHPKPDGAMAGPVLVKRTAQSPTLRHTLRSPGTVAAAPAAAQQSVAAARRKYAMAEAGMKRDALRRSILIGITTCLAVAVCGVAYFKHRDGAGAGEGAGETALAPPEATPSVSDEPGADPPADASPTQTPADPVVAATESAPPAEPFLATLVAPETPDPPEEPAAPLPLIVFVPPLAPEPSPPDEPEPDPEEGMLAAAAAALLEGRGADALDAIEGETLAGTREQLAAALEIDARVIRSFAPSKGQVISVEIRTGTVELEVGEVTEDGVEGTQIIRVAGGQGKRSLSLTVADLAPKEYARRSASAGRSALAIHHGLGALGKGDGMRAAKLFGMVDAPFGAALLEALEEKSSVYRTSLAEARAEESWPALLKLGQAMETHEDAEAFLAALADFRKDHGESDVARKNATKTRDLVARTEDLIVPTPSFPYSDGFEGTPAGPFETVRTGVGVWKVVKGKATIDSSGAVSGKQCLHLGGSGDDIIELTFPEPLPGGDMAIVFRAERLSADPPFEFRFLNGAGREIGQADGNIKTDPGIRLTVNLAGGGTRFRFRCKAPADAGILIDEIEIKQR